MSQNKSARVIKIQYSIDREHFVRSKHGVLKKMKKDTYVRVTTILKNHYLDMFERTYFAKIVRKLPLNWDGRVRIMMDIPERFLKEVVTFSSCNSYKLGYTYKWQT